MKQYYLHQKISLLKNLRQIICLAGLLFIFSAGEQLSAQCTIKVNSKKRCVGSPITFEGYQFGTRPKWDINGEGVDSSGSQTAFTFASPGLKKIKYSITLLNGARCNSSITVTVGEPPVSKLTFATGDRQCFEGNLFCYKDSSSGKNGVDIDSITYTISDGQYFVFAQPKWPKTFCFSVINPLGGDFSIRQYIKDKNGCELENELKNDIFVHPRIGPSFISNKPIACDSVKVLARNTSQLTQNAAKEVTWVWGDGFKDTGWGPNKEHWFKDAGVYNAKLIIETNAGCKDSFTQKTSATVFSICTQINSDKDSVCISNPRINFSVGQIPSGVTGFLWNFGNPTSGPINYNNRTWSPSHDAWGLGPHQISLEFSHPICGNKTLYDTILVIGPSSVIEKPFNRIEAYEAFQCPAYKQKKVRMTNLTEFYHNDNNFLDDNFAEVSNGRLKHQFYPNQVAVPYQGTGPNQRGTSAGVWRTWDFGDRFATACTTNVKLNQNVGVNCNYSNDSTPSHLYPSWSQIMLTDYKMRPMEDAIFFDSLRLCKKIIIWPSDSFYLTEDTFITVPFGISDSLKASAAPYTHLKTRNTLEEKGFKGPGSRYIINPRDMQIPTGTAVWIGDAEGKNRVQHSGTKVLRVNKDETVWLNSSSDSVTWLFTSYVKKDTLPLPMLALRNVNGEFPTITGRIKQNRPGKKGFDYDVNWKRWVDLYYATIPTGNTIKLVHQDTAHPFKCKSIKTKEVTMMQANAGGVRSGLRHLSFPCIGALHPHYGTTFLLEGLKPGSTFTDVQLNFDTFCGKDKWAPLSSLSPGNRPPGPPYTGYEFFGNVPNRFSKQYSAADVCNPNGCVTVGVIVGNGYSKSGKPLCSDTQYYPNFTCYPVIDPSFEILEPKVDMGKFIKVCRNTPIIARNKLDNVTKMDDLKNIRWELATPNAGPRYNKNFSYIIDETYYKYKKLDRVNGKQYDPKKLYNFMVQRRGARNPKQVPNTNIWEEGSSYVFDVVDTFVTAEIAAWDTLADISEVWEIMQNQIIRFGFDPFALTEKELARLIWNGVGIPGQPQTGARGCLDTSGFGAKIKFSLIPRNESSAKTLHFRDTSVLPLDTAYNPSEKKNVNAYTFRPPWGGYYVLSVTMTDLSGNCDDIRAIPFVAGFGMNIAYNDSITCQKMGNQLVAGVDFRMFHPDPQNFGTWDTYKHWKSDPWSGNPPKTPITRWDWNMADDDTSDRRTIFGMDPWASTGTGNPYKQIGSTYYYKNDTGVYTWRVIAGDTSGCIDTMAFKAYITRLEVDFDVVLDQGGAPNITFTDKSKILDPCSWALKDRNGQAVKCDSIRKWWINWGDGSPMYTHALPGKNIKDLNIQHAYNIGGTYKIEYVAQTAEGCMDTMQKTVNIPGPQPAFKIEGVPSREITIDSGESVTFENLSDSFSATTVWNWSFGDGDFAQRTIKTDVTHTYSKVGRFMVLLEQRNYSKTQGGQDLWRSSVFPDTMASPGFFVNVEQAVKTKPIEKENPIQIYPNPFKDYITLKSSIKIDAGAFALRIYNSQMQVVYESNTFSETIQLGYLTQGLYFAEIVNGEQSFVTPLVAE